MARRLKLTFKISRPEGVEIITLQGQYARTLSALVENGSKGITALELSSWALRLSHYVFILRTEYSLEVEMVREEHDGIAGAGWHGRYFLHTPVTLLLDEEAA
ncbi:MAG: hypothetical protein COA81_00865 [Alphaproteobacteria bacterium]|nr:MAG: hypothetical protein COA81_00865 [Alphaproteobacteria bacterium]